MRELFFKLDDVSLVYAIEEDREILFELATSDTEVKRMLFPTDDDEYAYKIFQDEDAKYFTGTTGKNAWLLIIKDDETIGAMAYTYNGVNGETVENFEMDIWFKSIAFTDKGLGSRLLITLTDYLHETYEVNTFLIRPFDQNKRAIRAYKKSGFNIIDNFDAKAYYGENTDAWGEGDFPGQTANMVKKY